MQLLTIAVLLLWTTVQGCFILGMHDQGATDREIDLFTNIIVPCESEWDTHAVNAWSGALGLTQFLPYTWTDTAEETGFYDWRNAYHQGWNASYLLHTEGRGQWDC